MKRAHFEPGTVVRLRWVDAQGTASGGHNTITEALAGYKPCIRHTIGYFVGYATNSGETALLIASDDDRTLDSPEAFGGIIYTPVGMIRDLKEVGAPIKNAKRTRRS
jgi:hypothetical protein